MKHTGAFAMKISFTSIIHKRNSIEKHYGSLQGFKQAYALEGIDNEFFFTHMHMFGQQLDSSQQYFVFDKLVYGEDFVALEEQSIWQIGDIQPSNLDIPVPGTEQITWLESLITREGNFVWPSLSFLMDSLPVLPGIDESNTKDALDNHPGVILAFPSCSTYLIKLDHIPHRLHLRSYDRNQHLHDTTSPQIYQPHPAEGPYYQGIYGNYCLITKENNLLSINDT